MIKNKELKVFLGSAEKASIANLAKQDNIRISFLPSSVGNGDITLMLTASQFNNIVKSKGKKSVTIVANRETFKHHPELLPVVGKGLPKNFDETSDTELADKLSFIPHFLGVFANDELPFVAVDSSQAQCGIANIADRATGGTHWVAFFNNPKYRIMEYFDPFGVRCTDQMNEFLNSYKVKVVGATGQIQELDSSACGYYCELFIRARNDGISFYDFIFTMFDDSVDKDEKTLRRKLDELTLGGPSQEVDINL